MTSDWCDSVFIPVTESAKGFVGLPLSLMIQRPHHSRPHFLDARTARVNLQHNRQFIIKEIRYAEAELSAMKGHMGC